MTAPRLLIALLALPLAACSKHAASPQPDAGPPGPTRVADPVAVASPRMGSGGYAFAAGNAWPGASVPNGMARVGPETTGPYQSLNFLHYDGYWAGDTSVLAFSHMHLAGTGAQDYGVLGVMPAAAFVPTQLRANDYQDSFDSSSEVATPGFYGVTLHSGIQVELTASVHAAHERFTFPTGASQGTLIVDLNHRIAQPGNTSVDPDGVLTLLPDNQTLQGHMQTHNGMSGGFELFFVIKFNRPWSTAHMWQSGALQSGSTGTVSGPQSGAALDFGVSGGQAVEAQVGLSLVSAEGAAANLAAELTSWDFQANRTAAAKAWGGALGALTVYVASGQDAQVATFYSALHHAFVMPGVYSDVDGAYRYAGQTASASGFHFMTDLSLWDTYRTLNPLYDLIAPDVALDVAKSLHAMAELSGSFPKWPLAASDSGTMIGSGADVVIAHTYLSGITGFDAEGAYKRLRDAALLPTLPTGEGRGGRDDFDDYARLGYAVPPGRGTVSMTCELNQDDFALSQLAHALGHGDDAEVLLARSRGYQKLYDPTTGLLRWRDADGGIPDDSFDPGSFSQDQEYVEADAYQSQFCAQWDAEGMTQLWGGRDKLVAGLENLFEESRTEREAAEADAASQGKSAEPNLLAVNLPPRYYFGGNEPDIHYAYLFAQVGRPDLTQQWVPWLRNHYFSSQPAGLPGNDDGGSMSAWYVFSALGFYPVPGSDAYVVGTPVFPKVEMALPGGTFTITAQGVSADNIYVQSATLNGAPLNAAVLHRADLKPGGTLTLVMGNSPSTWARSGN